MAGASSKPLAHSCVVALFLLLPAVVAGQPQNATTAHADPVTPVVLFLAVILAAGKLGGHLAVRFNQPAVLGELLAGVTLGSFDLAGLGWFSSIAADPTVETLARLGVVILLFEVGLESTVPDMLKVGLTAVLVAVLGVLAPFALGWVVERVDASGQVRVRPRIPRRDPDGDQRRHHRPRAAGSPPFAVSRSACDSWRCRH